jgi:hypothetical protein
MIESRSSSSVMCSGKTGAFGSLASRIAWILAYLNAAIFSAHFAAFSKGHRSLQTARRHPASSTPLPCNRNALAMNERLQNRCWWSLVRESAHRRPRFQKARSWGAPAAQTISTRSTL